MEPNPCPTAPHGSHTSGVSCFALLGLACQQRRNQTLEARCSGSANILGERAPGKGRRRRHRTPPDFSVSTAQVHLGLAMYNYWEWSSHCSRFSKTRLPYPAMVFRKLCERGGDHVGPLAGSGSPNLNQWLDYTVTEILGEGEKGSSQRRPPMSPKRHLALCAYCCHTLL